MRAEDVGHAAAPDAVRELVAAADEAHDDSSVQAGCRAGDTSHRGDCDSAGPDDGQAGRHVADLPDLPALDLLVRHQRDLGRTKQRDPPAPHGRSRRQGERRLRSGASHAPGRGCSDPGATDDRNHLRLHDHAVGTTQAVHRHRCGARRRLPRRHRDIEYVRFGRRVHRAAADLVELRAGTVPGLCPRPRPGLAGGSRERPHGRDDRPGPHRRGRDRLDRALYRKLRRRNDRARPSRAHHRHRHGRHGR